MSVVQFPHEPLQAIYLDQLPSGDWQGYFEGDQWTEPFRTDVGSLRDVLEVVARGERRCGLPIVNLPEALARMEAMPSLWPFSLAWPGGGAA